MHNTEALISTVQSVLAAFPSAFLVVAFTIRNVKL